MVSLNKSQFGKKLMGSGGVYLMYHYNNQNREIYLRSNIGCLSSNVILKSNCITSCGPTDMQAVNPLSKSDLWILLSDHLQ